MWFWATLADPVDVDSRICWCGTERKDLCKQKNLAPWSSLWFDKWPNHSNWPKHSNQNTAIETQPMKHSDWNSYKWMPKLSTSVNIKIIFTTQNVPKSAWIICTLKLYHQIAHKAWQNLCQISLLNTVPKSQICTGHFWIIWHTQNLTFAQFNFFSKQVWICLCGKKGVIIRLSHKKTFSSAKMAGWIIWNEPAPKLWPHLKTMYKFKKKTKKQMILVQHPINVAHFINIHPSSNI